MSYNKETDYQEKINEAVKAGDYESAAVYEKARNEKIDGENLPQEKTNNYSGWLDKTDYSTEIRNKISSEASRKSVSDSLKARIKKSAGTVGLSQYTYDDVYDEAIKYIMGGDNFSYEYKGKEPVYDDSNDSKIDKLYNELANMKDFSYDFDDDELYKYYKNQYNREGNRAMQDLLGILSMNTGGIPSSYAVSAAGQMLDEYNRKLTDKIPELYEAAYDRYLDSIENKRENLVSLAEVSDDRYNRYLDKLEQYNKDREFDYNSYMDALENNRKTRQLDHEVYLDELKQLSEERDFDYLKYVDALDEDYRQQKLDLDRENSSAENDYLLQKLLFETEKQEDSTKQKLIENALKKWQQLGYLDSESASILGLPAGLHTVDYDYKRSKK